MRERNALDDYYMYPEPPSAYELLGRYAPNGDFITTRLPVHTPNRDFRFAPVPQETAAFSSLSSANSTSRRIVPKVPNEIDELRRKSAADKFKAAVLERIEQFKINESQGAELDQSNRVAASKLPDLERKAPEEGKMKTDVLKERMALEREIAELSKRKEELENQFRILNGRLEERLKEVAGKEETVDRQAKEWIQKNIAASLRERALREKSALQEAESAALFRREEEMHEREEKMRRREEQVIEEEERMVRVQRRLNEKASSLATAQQSIDRFFEERREAKQKENNSEQDF
ncbi:uncharacterized protein Bfra_009969 [Botrytis fragariae]|uniref:Uncharacterized protein n=1 Tax=Botrytis fragariae TaxID=1964551 RepID=A0A8H6ANQ7_9HELO|nr:uncharacterized protein Bfra_009969 [Botrytis fragariae]KAF5870580.1 hypothetical protein Bfra_009969 [Botrytis fragariae]